MRNCEVYAYIERLHDALHSGLPDGDAVNDALDILSDFEEEVRKEMQAEAEQKSGLNSNPFFTKLAKADDEKVVDFCERMEEAHPELGEFMEYLMCRDDPTFLIAYGFGKDDRRIKTIGHCSGEWLYLTCQKLLSQTFRNWRGGNSK